MAAMSNPVGFQSPGNFAAPFGLGGFGSGIRSEGRVGSVAGNGLRGDTHGDRLSVLATLDERSVTEGAFLGVLEQEGATLRANLYHWSVLRCGSSSEERGNGSTIGFAQDHRRRSEYRRQCCVSGNPRALAYSNDASGLGVLHNMKRRPRRQATLNADCEPAVRVLGSNFFFVL